MASAGEKANKAFARIANKTAVVAGNPITFTVCLLVVVGWALSGPLFGFSDTWQLVINTGTTIVTFLMVFLIQNTQNRDGMAIQTKLDELILSSDAEDEFIGIEKLTDKELQTLQTRCAEAARSHTALAEKAGQEIESRRKKTAAKATPEKPAAQASDKPRAKTAAKPAPRRRPAA